MMTPSCEHDLPTELLVELFEELRRSGSSSDLVACMRCCRLWHDIITPILYTHVSLIYRLKAASEVPRFIQHAPKIDQVVSLNLSIHTNLLSGFRVRHPRALKSLEDLATGFQRMAKLKTFSLTMEPNVSRTPYAASLQLFVLPKILLSLPITVMNLELDTYGLDRNFDLPDHNGTWPGSIDGAHCKSEFCSAIAALLPRLHTLVLRVAQVCGKAFSPLSKISEVAPSEGPLIHNSAEEPETSSIVSPLRHIFIYMELDRTGASYSRWIPKIPSYTPSQFPHLQSFIILEHVPKSGRDDGGFVWATWNIRNLVSNTLFQFPYLEAKASNTDSALFNLRDINGQDHVLKMSAMLAGFRQGCLPWTVGDTGVRVPPSATRQQKVSVKQLPHGDGEIDLDVGEGCHIRLAGVMDRATAEVKRSASMNIWKWEAITRCSLMAARCRPGAAAEQAADVRLELPRGWEWSQHIDGQPITMPTTTVGLSDEELAFYSRESEFVPVYKGI